MNVDLGGAVASVSLATSVLSDYLQELYRIERFPHSMVLRRTIGGADVDLTLLLDPPRFEMAHPVGLEPFTRLVLTGVVEVRPAGQPNAPPEVHVLDAKALLTLTQLPTAEVGMRYGGVESAPAAPLASADIDEFFATPAMSALLDSIRLPLAQKLIEGLNVSIPGGGIPVESWGFDVTLMPASADTVDSFAATVALLGSATPALRESFVATNSELAVAYNRIFLDLMMGISADAKVGTVISDAKILDLLVTMTDDAIQVVGHAEREVTIFPNVNVSFTGPMHPSLVRGTTVMSFNMNDVVVEIDQSDEIFFTVLKWFVTALAGALLFTGVGSLTIIGIALWATAVQKVWNIDVDIDNAPNALRDNLAAALGAAMSVLTETLDDETPAGELRIDATPDNLQIVNGNMVFSAQILVVPLAARLVGAEYSKKLRRFAIIELEGGRRFRAQELARLMAAGKVTVPGFHHVRANYIRANHDDVEANNLPHSFKSNETTEAVLRNVRP